MGDVDTVIGRQLARLRNGRSQAEVAAAMHDHGWPTWSPTTVWAIEAGRRSLKLAEARDLASYLGRAIEDLLPEMDPERLRRRRAWLEAELARAHQMAREAEERAAELTAQLAEVPRVLRPPESPLPRADS